MKLVIGTLSLVLVCLHLILPLQTYALTHVTIISLRLHQSIYAHLPEVEAVAAAEEGVEAEDAEEPEEQRLLNQ